MRTGASILRTGTPPKYGVLAEAMRQRIQRGTWGPGQCIPSLHELAESFGVARLTARQAVQVLVQEGLLQAEQGRGTFVSGEPRALKNIRVQTTLKALSDMYVKAPPEIRTLGEQVVLLSPQEGAPECAYVQLRRVHSDGGTPYCVIMVHVQAEVFALAPRRFRQEAAIPVLLSLVRRRIASARQTLLVGALDAETAGLLGVAAGSPAAYVRRVFAGRGGQVLYFADVTYRGDLVKLDIELAV
jgi:GntR family transcriptional regulator